MITKIVLENYRAFENAKVELSNINLFFGPNNSGKSSLISVINVLSQTLQSPDSDIPILLNGKFEDLGTYVDMVFANDVSRKIKVGIQGEFRIAERIVTGRKRGPSTIEIVERELHPYWLDVTFSYMKQRHELILEKTELKTENGDLLFRTRRSKMLGRQKVEELSLEPRQPKERADRALHMMNFMPMWTRYLWMRHGDKRDIRNYRNVREYTDSLHNYLSNLEFVGPFRAYPERLYFHSGESPLHVGKHGEKAIDILVADEKRRGKKKKGITNSVSEWISEAKIAKSIEVYTLTDRHLEILVENIETNEVENLADTGFGCSQVLPIIVAGVNCEPNSLLIVQQPEIHLHPNAQAALGTFLYKVAQKGVQIIVETHSEHILLRLQSHVASGEMKADSLNVYYYDSDNRRKTKIIKRLPVGEDGLFTENWPRGFFPERLAEAKRLAKLSLR